MRLTFRGRETLAVTALVLGVVAVAAVGHVTSVARITLRASASEAELLAHQLFHQSASVIAASRQARLASLRHDSGIRALLEGIVGYSHTVVYAAIVDPAGVAVVHSSPALEGQALAERERLDDVLHAGTASMVLALLGGARTYETRLAMEQDGRAFGVVRVGVSTSLLRQEVMRAVLSALALAAGALVVAVGVGLGAGRVVLHSLRRIAEGMEQLARGRYDSVVDLTRDDELGELAARVNQLGQRVQADVSQWQSERQRMEGILNSLEDAVLVLNARREVTFCNQAMERLLDRGRDLVVGRSVDDLLPPGHPLLAAVGRLFEEGEEPRKLPVNATWPDGRARELALSGYRAHEGEQSGGAVLALKDLDPVRALESLVAYSRKLAALGRLTSGAAHEIKNPLNAMRIHLELLRTRLGGARPEVMASLDVLAEEIQRLDRVVQGFLKFMRPEELRLEPLSMEALLADVARRLELEAAGAGVRIVRETGVDLAPVAGDRELLHQAFTNLVTNAIQALTRGGTVTLAARPGRDDTVEVRVIDDGAGIPAEDLDRIFRLYYTTKAGGSGIGLSLVYRIVQMHDGRIDVESAVGKGTTMTVVLPVAQDAAVR